MLRHWEYSETSQTVALFSREHGVIRGLAKGARRERGSFCGGFEVLTYGEIGAITKPSTDLATLTDWDLQEVFWSTRRGLLAHRAGLYAADLLHHALRAGDAHPELFDAALRLLRGLGDAARIASRILQFQWILLVETGYRPRLQGPGDDGGPAEPRQRGKPALCRFSPLHGGVIPLTEQVQNVWMVRVETIDALRAAERGAGLDAVPLVTLVRASRLLGAYLHVLLERELPTHEAYFAVLPGSTTMGRQTGARVAGPPGGSVNPERKPSAV